MEMYQLRAYVTAATLGSVTRTAEALHLTQPAITAQIKALEEELGVALFDRRPGRISLTRAGEALMEPARQVLDAAGRLQGQARELQAEPPIPFEAEVLHRDAHLLVADKPHFLPVVPAGKYLQQTLLVRLKREFDLPELSPIHRIDRDTAGLVVFSVQRATRGIYQALFRDRAIHKTYEAVAPWREDVVFPRTHESRMEESGHFFRMHEVAGTPNTRTHMQVLEQHGPWARYRLEPESGKRHQLRVHMAALGLPLWGDGFYPEVHDMPEGDYSRPLQLLARSLAFTDPLDGQSRRFDSRRQLLPLTDL